MKLKLACADYTFPLLPHDDVLTLIATLGIRNVDIGLFEHRSHLQPSDQFKNVSRSAKALKKKLDSRGLKAADVFLQVVAEIFRNDHTGQTTRFRTDSNGFYTVHIFRHAHVP